MHRWLTQEDLRHEHVEERLERLDRVGQRDGHRRERHVGGDVTEGVHRGGQQQGLELVLGDGTAERSLQRETEREKKEGEYKGRV